MPEAAAAGAAETHISLLPVPIAQWQQHDIGHEASRRLRHILLMPCCPQGCLPYGARCVLVNDLLIIMRHSRVQAQLDAAEARLAAAEAELAETREAVAGAAEARQRAADMEAQLAAAREQADSAAADIRYTLLSKPNRTWRRRFCTAAARVNAPHECQMPTAGAESCSCGSCNYAAGGHIAQGCPLQFQS